MVTVEISGLQGELREIIKSAENTISEQVAQWVAKRVSNELLSHMWVINVASRREPTDNIQKVGYIEAVKRAARTVIYEKNIVKTLPIAVLDELTQIRWRRLWLRQGSGKFDREVLRGALSQLCIIIDRDAAGALVREIGRPQNAFWQMHGYWRIIEWGRQGGAVVRPTGERQFLRWWSNDGTVMHLAQETPLVGKEPKYLLRTLIYSALKSLQLDLQKSGMVNSISTQELPLVD